MLSKIISTETSPVIKTLGNQRHGESCENFHVPFSNIYQGQVICGKMRSEIMSRENPFLLLQCCGQHSNYTNEFSIRNLPVGQFVSTGFGVV